MNPYFSSDRVRSDAQPKLGEDRPGASRPKLALVVALAGSMIYQDQASGGDRLFVELSRRLDPRRYRIIVLTAGAGAKLWGRESQRQVVINPFFFERIAGRKTAALIYVLRTMRMSLALNKIMAATSLPIILYSSSDYLPDTLLPFLLKSSKRRIAWISRVYHVVPSPGTRKGNLLVNLLSFTSQRLSFLMMKRRADLIVTLNSSVQKQLESLGFSGDGLGISGGGVDYVRISSVPYDGRKTYDGVFLGRIHPNKGILDLLEIWVSVTKTKRDAKLAIIGGGEREMTDFLDKRIRELGLEQNIDFLGFVSDDNRVYEILKSSRFFLFTDHENGWGLAICEAMACGVPVLAYHLDIFGSVYVKGFATVPIFEKDKFATRLVGLLENEPAMTAMSKDALDQAKSLDWSTVTTHFSSLLDLSIERAYGTSPAKSHEGWESSVN